MHRKRSLPMFIRRSFPRLSAILLVVMLLAACGGAPSPADQAPNATAAVDAPAATAAPDAAEAPDATADTEAPDATAAPDATPIKAEGEPAGGSGTAGVETSGSYVADLGFRPDANGFGFPNYGGQGETNLTPNDLRRMFGHSACTSIEGGECTLTPPGNQWLEQINSAMNGGHCEGMAVLSNLFYTGKIKPADFGADAVPALQIAGNEPLQREIAYWWATQSTQPARSGI